MSERSVQPQDVFEVREIWRRLCELQKMVWDAKSSGGGDPADCFCGEGGYWPLRRTYDFRNSLYAVEYIERAVKQALREDSIPYGQPALPHTSGPSSKMDA